MKPHKHSELIKAWADGAIIEFRTTSDSEWCQTDDPFWNYNTLEFRIQPEESKWYNNISEHGRLCWVTNTGTATHIDLVYGYCKETGLFYTASKTVISAKPLTDAEIINYFVDQ